MSVEIKVPDMGESIVEATIVQWMKQDGDPVAAGEALAELETDKVTLEVNAPQSGVLRNIQHAAGENVAVGDVLATLEVDGAGAPVRCLRRAGDLRAPRPPRAESKAVRATPVAERMAQEKGIDLNQVTPTGSAGRVTKEDVRGYLEQAGGAPAAQPASVEPETKPTSAPAAKPPEKIPQGERREERVRMSRRRQTIARRLVEAQHTAAMLTTFNEIDMSAVIDLRKRRREDFKTRFGVDLGYMSFFVKACIGALKAFPRLNAEIDGDEIVLKYYYDIGIAIGAEEGLVVPVVRDADKLNFAGIEMAIRGFVGKVKDGTLGLEDLRGGTFTITNGGVYGSLMSTPILNPPQVAILGMHAIKDRPVVVEGQMVIRPMMYVAVSYDHRIVDGSEAVKFLVRIKELVEDPLSLLLE